MNELRAEHEQSVQDITQKLTQKSDTEISKLELQHKEAIFKLKEELIQKEDKIKLSEKNEKKNQIEKEKLTNQQEQYSILQERLKNIQTDRDLIEKEKTQLLDTVKTKEGLISDLKDQVKNFEIINAAIP